MESAETELKLAVTPRTLARLAQDPWLGTPRGAPQRLVAAYFDTSRRALWKRGLTLRLRRERGHWVQTVKGAGSVEGGLHRRAEFSRRAARGEPDATLLGESELETFVARAARDSPLVPQFRVEIERAVREVQTAPGVEIEVSLDRGVIAGGEARTTVCEIELELKHGSPASLFEFARQLAARYTVRAEPRSKAERGFELIGAARVAPVRASLGVIRREMSTAQAYRAACVACLNHFQANQRGVLRGEDPEYVHQARVALRRLRSVLDAYGPLLPAGTSDAHIKALRRLTRALGPAREWDVFVTQTLAPALEHFHGHRGLAAFERACARLRENANLAARRAVAGRGAQRLLLELGGWLAAEPWLAAGAGPGEPAWQAPVVEFAAEVLERYHRRMVKRGRGIRTAGAARLHRLRIAAKRLRYAMGFFAPLFPRARVKPWLAGLADLQDVLGAINDCAAAPALIAGAAAAARGPLRTQGRTILTHWNTATLARRRAELKGAWKAVRRCDPFWR